MPLSTRLIYNGYWFHREGDDSKQLMLLRKSQWTSKLALYSNVIVIGRQSPNSLYDEDLATESSAFDQRDAEGFIKLNALRLKKNKLKF